MSAEGGLRRRYGGRDEVDAATSEGEVADKDLKVGPELATTNGTPPTRAAIALDNRTVHSSGLKADWFEKNERGAAWVVFFIALFTRFYRLDQPKGVVFDETHFGKFTNWYTEHKFYFDIHPPLGKLTFWFFGRVLGYDASKCEFVDLNRQYAPDCKYYILRFVAASFSTASCVLMFYCARNLGCSVKGAMVAALLLVFDMINIGEGRLILMDSQLIFWLLATLLVAQEWWKRLNQHDALLGRLRITSTWTQASGSDESGGTDISSGAALAKRVEAKLASAGAAGGSEAGGAAPMTWLERKLWCVAVGVTCGNAINIKMTGLVTPALIAMESFFGAWFLNTAVPFDELLLTLFSAVLTYSFWFACSFALFQNSGPNKVEQEFMTPLFQATLKGSDNYDPTGQALRDWRSQEGFWWTMVTHNARMIKHNANILAPHPWQTTWWEWLLDLRGVAYYGKDEGFRYHTQVYLLGNAAVLWSVLGAVIASVLVCTLYVRYRNAFPARSDVHNFAKQATFCLLGYGINLLPYLGVARSTFLYHYMPALCFGQIITARLLEVCVPARWHSAVFKTYLLIVVAVYLHFAAWIYAFPLQPEAQDRRRWMPRWN